MTAQAESPRSVSLWQKIIEFPLSRLLLAALVVVVGVAFAQEMVVLLGLLLTPKETPLTGIPYYSLFLIASVLAATQGYRLYVRLIEKRPVSELATNGAWREGGTGALFGIALIAAILAILGLLRVYTITGFANATDGYMTVFASLTNDISGAFVEEILLRAIVFRITEEALGTWWALLISAILFTGLHLVDNQGSTLSALMIGVEGTLLLCGAWMLTRRLWLAVGIHAGWDFAQGGIFGVGPTIQDQAHAQLQAQGLVHGQLTGAPILTGGAAGVEASIVAFVVVMAAAIFLLLRARQHGRFIARPQRTPSSPPFEDTPANPS